MSAPHRHDLSPSSCVNTEVKTFNRRMKKLMKTFPHVTTMDIDLVRKHFTTHGLHMNSKGKYEMAQRIATQIMKVVTGKKEKNPIVLPWNTKVDTRQQNGDISNQERILKSVDISQANSNLELKEGEDYTKTSRRLRKQPVSRSKDLWTSVSVKKRG